LKAEFGKADGAEVRRIETHRSRGGLPFEVVDEQRGLFEITDVDFSLAKPSPW
jgi:hypothetical protein